MKAIINGRVLLPETEVQGKALLYNERIVGLTETETALSEATEIIDAQGAYVSPGLIDAHIHGYLGADVSDANPEGVRRMAEGILKNGVTSFLPTTLTVAWETLETVCGQLRVLREESLSPDFRGAEILGVHLEGPFVNPAKKGAQNEKYILPPDAEKLLPLKDIVRAVTFAPEMPGGPAFIRAMRANTQIALSMGHTNATYDQAMAAIGLGVTRVTHLFNAMTPLHHRDPGVVGAALSSDVYTELIADTFHVDKGVYPLLAKAKGRRLVLITDALNAAGMPDGEYENGGQVFVLRGIQCKLLNGTIAGSVLKLNQGVRNYRDYGGVSMHEAVRAASLSAAESINAADRKGSLEPGKDADIILLDEECSVKRAIIRGVCKYVNNH